MAGPDCIPNPYCVPTTTALQGRFAVSKKIDVCPHCGQDYPQIISTTIGWREIEPEHEPKQSDKPWRKSHDNPKWLRR